MKVKTIIKKTIPYAVIIALIVLAVVLHDAYEKSRPKQGWMNGLAGALKYYNSNTGEWRTADGWTEEVNQFVRNQAALPKFEGVAIVDVVRGNINYSYDTAKPIWKVFLKKPIV